ncbi:Protein-glutamine gamma-glutamyltransferase K [Holothuria leucospilota]|uniref:Protein-glutamine gamma-glutamyltransferase K n=1 Tax=Holothuria leucospilota TaxID=206669 RepID=A0A9Q1BRI5_HOLLE|nr:Protein-glutamine gamma-glutamyltransferase K [Holothuria leucospilota]
MHRRGVRPRNERNEGRLVVERGPQGSFRLIYLYGGRRYDVTKYFLENPISPEAPPASSGQLKVENVDLKISENRTAHRTDKYEVSDLILRRGQEFTIDLKLSRPFKKSEDVIGVEFRTGEHPLTSDGTLVVAKMVNKFDARQWGFKVASSSGNNVTLTVKSSANALVGEHQLDIVTHVTKDGAQEHRFRKGLKTTVYILFNPWCKDDNVYMDGDAEKEEYVLNDLGNIWYGTSRYLGKMDWNFGQFDAEVFECVLYLLEKHLPVKNRNDPVLVSRTMSAAVNVQDEGGVLEGRWDGDYEDGARPTSWRGSVAILEQYLKTKESVKYGQCWVFSGVLTTVLRCLGVPARSVTNFSSAHDTDRSVTIDNCVDENNEEIADLNYDSVWNFHVWNDCWMTRPDLPVGFGGWQAVDATPQETSEGIFQTGPCSLNAIKQGQVYLPYDAPFVFAEVNADRIYWSCKWNYGDWEMTKIRTERSSIGKNMSTKSIGSSIRHDVTDQYKYPEGSHEERVAVRKAIQYGDRPEIVEDEVMSKDISYDIVNKDVLFLGKDFEIQVNLKNNGTVTRTVHLTTNIQVCYYTGVFAARIKKEKQTHVLTAGQSKTASVNVTVSEYLDKLVEQSQFKVFLLGKVEETNQLIADQDDFRLETPFLDVKVAASEQLRVGRPCKVALSFKNPLSRTLTGCTFTVEGPGLTKPKIEKFRDVSPGEDVKHEITLSPLNSGKRTIVADFDCHQFENVMGSLEVNIKA